MGIFLVIPIRFWVIFGAIYGAFVAPYLLPFGPLLVKAFTGLVLGGTSGFLFWHANLRLDAVIEESFRRHISGLSKEEILEHYYDDSIWNGRDYCLDELITRNEDSYIVLPHTIERLIYECDLDGVYPEWARYYLPTHFPEIFAICPHLHEKIRGEEYERERLLLQRLVEETESLRDFFQSELGTKESLREGLSLLSERAFFQRHELGLQIVMPSVLRRYDFSNEELDLITDNLLMSFTGHIYARGLLLKVLQRIQTPLTYAKLENFLETNDEEISGEEREEFVRLLNTLRVWMERQQHSMAGQVSVVNGNSLSGEVSLFE
jgi:hypothetical protein